MAALLLSQGMSGRQVAKRLHMRPETLSRWKRIPEFLDALEHVMTEEQRAVQHRMMHLTEAAVSVVWGELHNPASGQLRTEIALKLLAMMAKKPLMVADRTIEVPKAPNP